MSQTLNNTTKQMYDALRKALSSWNKQNAAAETLLPELLAVQYEQEQLNAGDNPAMLRAATNQVLKDAIADLEKQEPVMARILRLRFIDKMPIFNSKTRHCWDYILMYTDLSDEHSKFFERKISDQFTGDTVDSIKGSRIFVRKWADLLEEASFRMDYISKELEEKKKKMLPKQEDRIFLEKKDNLKEQEE